MVSHLVFYQLGLIVLVWVFLMLSGLWPSAPAAARPMPPQPLLPRCKHAKKPNPFPGLTRQPCCTACEEAIETPRLQPSVAYLLAADNSIGHLLSHLRGAQQPVVRPRNAFSAPRSHLLVHLVVSLQRAGKYQRPAWRP